MSEIPLTPRPEVPLWFREPSLGQRLGGAIIDTVVVLPVMLILWVLLPSAAGAIATVAVRSLYEIVLLARNGQTVGKAMVGTKVVMFSDGGGVSPGAAALRWFTGGSFVYLGRAVPAIRLVSTFTTLVTLGMILQPPLHRGLPDRVAGTVVTRAWCAPLRPQREAPSSGHPRPQAGCSCPQLRGRSRLGASKALGGPPMPRTATEWPHGRAARSSASPART